MAQDKLSFNELVFYTKLNLKNTLQKLKSWCFTPHCVINISKRLDKLFLTCYELKPLKDLTLTVSLDTTPPARIIIKSPKRNNKKTY